MSTGVLIGTVHIAYMEQYSYHYYGNLEDKTCLPEDSECIAAS